MLAVVIRGNEGTRLNRRIQPDPSRSFPNKRSGRRSKMLTFVTALKYQKDNRRISLQGPHFTNPPIPGYCFSVWLPHCRAFRTIPQTPRLFASLPLTLKAWRGQSSRQQCYEITHWPPCSLRQSGPIQLRLAGLSSNRSRAAFSCNLCPRETPTHLLVRHPASPIDSDYTKLQPACAPSTIYDDQKCHWKSWSAILGCNCILLIAITG